MKYIQLPKNQQAIVDDIDFQKVNSIKWHKNTLGYVEAWEKGKNHKTRKRFLLHRFIMNFPQHKVIDHINHNLLDNRRSNLRICKQSENIKNMIKSKANTSGYKGVSWSKQRKKWVVHISVNNKVLHIGYSRDIYKAAIMYNEAAIKYHGKFAYINTIEQFH